MSNGINVKASDCTTYKISQVLGGITGRISRAIVGTEKTYREYINCQKRLQSRIDFRPTYSSKAIVSPESVFVADVLGVLCYIELTVSKKKKDESQEAAIQSLVGMLNSMGVIVYPEGISSADDISRKSKASLLKMLRVVFKWSDFDLLNNCRFIYESISGKKML